MECLFFYIYPIRAHFFSYTYQFFPFLDENSVTESFCLV